MHAHTHAQPQTPAHTGTHARTNAETHAETHAETRTHARTHAETQTQMQVVALLQSCSTSAAFGDISGDVRSRQSPTPRVRRTHGGFQREWRGKISQGAAPCIIAVHAYGVAPLHGPHAFVCACVRACVRGHACVRLCACACARVRVCACACMRACACASCVCGRVHFPEHLDR